MTVRRPYAWAIAAGFKPIENRTWRPSTLPITLAIHCGKRAALPAELEDLETKLGPAAVRAQGGMDDIVRSMSELAGMIVALAEITVAAPAELTALERRWWAGPDWIPWRVRLLKTMPYGRRVFRGRLSLWTVQ